MLQTSRPLKAGQWTESALKVMKERYLARNSQGVQETPEEMCWRVAMAIAAAEGRWGKGVEEIQAIAAEFYDMMVDCLFLPNSPTLMNAGLNNGLGYSACFVLPVEDSIDGIFDAVKHAALVHKAGGGTGFAFSRLRPKGSRVKTTNGVASGPVSFLRVFDAATEQIKQGGRRRGANMGILRVDHPDILEFIQSKLSGGITNFNISVATTEKFMEALSKDKPYDLIDPYTKQVAGSLSAREVFEQIIRAAWQTGDPGMVFIDRINASRANPVPEAEQIEATNPCITGDTRLHTQYGLVQARELYEQQLPLRVTVDTRALWAGKGVTIRDAVPVFMTAECADVFRVITEAGYEIRATRWHDFYTTRGKIKLRDLRLGDELLVQSAEGQWGQEGDYQLGMLIGVMTGDGYFTSDRGAVINLWGEDIALAAGLAAYINELVKGTARGSRPEYEVSPVPVPHRNLTTIRSTRLARILEGHGFTAATKLRVPEVVWRGNRDCVVGYLRGLFQTDGTVNISGHSQTCSVRLASSNVDLLKDVQRLLANFGIFSAVRFRRKAGARLLPDGRGDRKLYQCRADYELIIGGESRSRFMQEIGFLTPTKNEKYRQWAEDRLLRQKQRFTTKVAAIVYEGQEPVYDTTQPDHHAVIFNGLVTAQCGEQPLGPNDACTLGSINLARFALPPSENQNNGHGQIDWSALERVVRLSVRFLDDVLEVNPYPLPAIAEEVQLNRRIGLGIMGWADLLLEVGIPYGSEEALALADRIMAFIERIGHDESARLATERGPFPRWSRSIYRDDQPMRNSTVTTVAPTGTISIIAGCSSGIEPLFAVAFSHIVGDRHLTFVNPQFERVAKALGFYSEGMMSKVAAQGTVQGLPEVPADVQGVFVTAHQIAPEWHVRMQAAFQQHLDNGCSKTINLPHSATVEDVGKAYLLAYEVGCLGITVFRDGCKTDQVLHVGTGGKEAKDQGTAGEDQRSEPSAQAPTPRPRAGEAIKPRPRKVQGVTYRVATPLGTAFITVNTNGHGEPFEVFANVGKAGSDTASVSEAMGRLISLALRLPSPLTPTERLREIVGQLQGIGGGRHLGYGPARIRSLPDAIAQVIAEHVGMIEVQEPTTPQPLHETVGDLCPDCGQATLVYEEGCQKCYSCGYAEC